MQYEIQFASKFVYTEIISFLSVGDYHMEHMAVFRYSLESTIKPAATAGKSKHVKNVAERSSQNV